MSTEHAYDTVVLDLYSSDLPMTNDRVMAVTKQLLEATDWMGLSDTPTMSTAWATYRATLRNLENAILDFNGCALVISHDRFFLDRICTHLLVFEGDSKVRWFEGNFEEYQEKRKKELGGREENRRSKYKKLTIR